MQLTHIALWTNHLERLRDFYVKYFNGKSNEKYVNSKKGFASYFVSFESGPALEIMQRQDITEAYDKDHIGLAHLAFHADKKEQVDQMIERFRMDGYTIPGSNSFFPFRMASSILREPTTRSSVALMGNSTTRRRYRTVSGCSFPSQSAHRGGRPGWQ